MAKITSVKTSADNNKLFTAQINDDNTREIKEYDITSGINNKSLNNTADVTSFDEGMDVITVNPSGDKFVGVDRRGREVVNLETTNNFSVNSFNLLSSFKVDRLVRGDVFNIVESGYDPSFIFQTTSPEQLTRSTDFRKVGVLSNGEVLIPMRVGSSGLPYITKFNINTQSIDNTFTTGNFSNISGTASGCNIMGIYVLPDDRFIVYGKGIRFYENTPINGFAIFNSDGTFNNSTLNITLSYNSNTATIYKVSVDNQGRILFGGWFNRVTYDSTTYTNYNNLIRTDSNLNLDISFDPEIYASSIIHDFFVDDNNQVVCASQQFYSKDTNGALQPINGKDIYVVNDNGTIDENRFSNFNVTPYPTSRNTTFSRVYGIKKLTNGNILMGGVTGADINGQSSNGAVLTDNQGNYITTNQTFTLISTTINIEQLNDGTILYGKLSSNSTVFLNEDLTEITPLPTDGITPRHFTYFIYNNEIYVCDFESIRRVIPGGNQFVTTTEIPFETMGVTSDRLIKLNTSNNTSTASNDFNTITISDGTNSVSILPSQINTQINANSLIGRNLTVTYDLTGNKDINTVLSEYNLTINK